MRKKITFLLALGLMMMSLGAQSAQAATKDAVSQAKEQLEMYLDMMPMLGMVPMDASETVEWQDAYQDALTVYKNPYATLDDVNDQITILDAIAASHGQDFFDIYRTIMIQQLSDLAKEDDNEECKKIIADAIALVNEQIGTYNTEKTFMENAQNIEPLSHIYNDVKADLEKARPKVYAVFDLYTNSLTYFYDIKYDETNPNHRLYDPSNQDRFKTINDQIQTVIIDASMKDAKLTSTACMFYCGDLTTVKYSLANLTTIFGLENLNTENVTSMYCMFKGCKSLQGKLDLRHFNTGNVVDMSGMFFGCESLTGIDLRGINTQNVEYTERMFIGCEELTEIDLRGFNVKKMKSMDLMFSGCKKLTTIYGDSDWREKAADLTSSTGMFSNCDELVGGNGTAYDGVNKDVTYAHPDKTGNPGYFSMAPKGSEIYAVYEAATKTETLYYDNKCIERGGSTSDWWIIELPYSEIITVVLDESMKYARPQSIDSWFEDYTNLKEIKHLDYLNTSEVTDMSAMFRSCTLLTTLDLSSFDVTKVTNMKNMFFGCTSLKTIFCEGDWSGTSATTSDMFYACSSLVGANGTIYDSKKVDKTYARLDQDGAAGYFTGKTSWEVAQKQLKASVDDLNALYNFAAQYVSASELATFKTGIEALEAVNNAPDATLPEVKKATSDAKLAITGAIAVFIPAGKSSLKETIGNKLMPGDNEKCKKIIKDAQDAVDALEWKNTETVKQNIATLDPAIKKILADVDAALAAERTATGLETVTSDQSPITNKILRDGKLFIIHDGQIYTIQGARIQ